MATKFCNSDLSEFLDACAERGVGKMFLSERNESAKFVQGLRKIHAKFREAFHSQSGKSGHIARTSCLFYEALVYKFGPANRHQKFWKTALQIHRELGRLNSQDVFGPFLKFIEKLEQSSFMYSPTKRAMCCLGALLLKRILQLDRLRLICARSADSSMGFIELRHFATSDVASEAYQQMQQLGQIYDSLNLLFRRYSHNFPSSVKSLRLVSIRGHLHADRNVGLLKEHDLALLRREIEGIGQEPADMEDFAKIDVLFAMNNPAFRRFTISKGSRKVAAGSGRRKKWN